MQDELDAANAHLSADYFFPKDATGHKGVTAIALRDRATKLLDALLRDDSDARNACAVGSSLVLLPTTVARDLEHKRKKASAALAACSTTLAALHRRNAETKKFRDAVRALNRLAIMRKHASTRKDFREKREAGRAIAAAGMRIAAKIAARKRTRMAARL